MVRQGCVFVGLFFIYLKNIQKGGGGAAASLSCFLFRVKGVGFTLNALNLSVRAGRTE